MADLVEVEMLFGRRCADAISLGVGEVGTLTIIPRVIQEDRFAPLWCCPNAEFSVGPARLTNCQCSVSVPWGMFGSSLTSLNSHDFFLL